ncbi:MAG: AhpC/TSA family protein [Prolixibacteraceae bacterium]|nr:AhpC/TSA family protein [Prolixibacteraceae bacterium]MBN2648214.1 AhpC/TSA family protein [Prolixibacteraceae bacterium]
MKKLMSFVAAALLLAGCSNKNEFKINGKIVPESEGNVILYGYEDGKPVAQDTSDASSGTFTFSGEVSLPDLKLIGFEGEDGYIGQLFVEPGKINMTIYPDSFQNNVISGSDAQDVFQSYLDEIIRFTKSEGELEQRFRQAQMGRDEEEMSAIQFEYETMIDNTQLYTKNFIKEHGATPVSAYVYLMNFVQSAELEELDSILTIFEPIKENDFVAAISERAEVLRVSGVGAQAPDFTLDTPDGEKFSLSDYRGKYVLIDFWASWCQPCMVEMPNVIELYKKYSENGFEIVGVSLDRSREPWVNTLGEMEMNWVHGWDLANAENQGVVANKYGVTAIPHTVLLDKEGKIIAKNLRGDQLGQKLAELLD